MLYIDDGAFVFESRTDIEKGITLLSDHFDRFGLEMHIGMKPTKTTEKEDENENDEEEERVSQTHFELC